MITKSYTKIVNFITLVVGDAVLGCGHIGDIVKMLNSLKSIPGHSTD